MSDETKGQPEPVGWIVRRAERSTSSVLLTEHHAKREAAYWREYGHSDAEARPLYDYDVPVLLERQEKLVEALERARRFIRNGIEWGHIQMPDAGSGDSALEVPAIIDDALAAAREES